MEAGCKITVSGKVTNVGFRFFTVGTARELGISGWVKNTENGEVKILAEGERKAIEKLIEWAKKGPPLSKVDKVEVEWQNLSEEFSSFEMIS